MKKQGSAARRKIFLLLASGLAFRLLLAAALPGFRYDLECFHLWALMAAKSNLFSFYAAMGRGHLFVNYPPLYIYILFPIGKLLQLLGLTELNRLGEVLLKLPSIFADLVTAYLLYQWSGKHLSRQISLGLAAFYLFNPVIWYDSAIWGQVDSFFTLLVFVGFMALASGKTVQATIPLTAAVLMKPQGLFFLPVLFFELVREKRMVSFLKAAGYATLTVLTVVLPFSRGFDLRWLVKLYLNTAGDFTYASVNADNIFTMVGENFVKDSHMFCFLPYRIWSCIFIAGLIGFIVYLYFHQRRKRDISSLTGLLMVFGAFMLLTRMHERYMFPALILVLLAFVQWRDRRLLRIYGGMSLTGILNMCFLPFPGNLLISVANLVLLGYLGKVAVDLIIRNRGQRYQDRDSFAGEILLFGKEKGQSRI